MRIFASKVGKNGIRPLTHEPDTRSAADDVRAARSSKGFAKRVFGVNNGRSQGRKVSGGADITGGAL